jgi:prepilin-type N-terminal cleavage/methylation domain-containing protein
VSGATQSPGRSREGFTLLEVLAVMALTAGLLTMAVNFYLQLSRATTVAVDRTRDGRRGVGVVDRVARDLEGTVLLKKPEAVDPLAHPWLFLAESDGRGSGASRIKFDTRSLVPRASDLHASDLAVVTYQVVPTDDGALALLRSVTPRLPEQLDRSFPRADDPGVEVLADDLVSFGLRLLDEDGAWSEEWDSSTLARSSTLPIAVEIAAQMLPEAEAAEAPQPLVRRVLLPVRPVDLEALLGAGDQDQDGDDEEDEEENADCVTVGECIALNPEAFDLLMTTNPDLRPVIDSIRGQCFSDHASSLSVQVEGCE